MLIFHQFEESFDFFEYLFSSELLFLSFLNFHDLRKKGCQIRL